MITADGWVSWAIRLPATKIQTNPGTNGVRGIFMHSAEGYAGTLLSPTSQWGFNGNHSWHLTNIFDGRLYQHYPLTARCWHATAANQEYIGVENEGDAPKEASLTEAQIATAVRLIDDVATWKGWMPRRPVGPADKSHTLWEHNEVTRLGGTSSACPSGRIPWAEILRRLDAMPAEHNPGELNERRAREVLNYWMMTGDLRIRHAPDGLEILDKNYQSFSPAVIIKMAVPWWGAAT